MARRGRLDRERYWRAVIREQRASGLSISAFCRQRELSAGSFFNWRRKLAERRRKRTIEPERPAAKFVPIELSAPRAVRRAGCEVVLPNGCRIVVPAQCDAGWLREIVVVLEERSC